MRRAMTLTWPALQWNEWLTEQIRSLCEPEYASRSGRMIQRTVVWTGSAAAGKTFAAGAFACAWFLAGRLAPEFDSFVRLTSTTKDMIGKRVWPVIRKFYTEACDVRGIPNSMGCHMVDSRKMLQHKKGDEKFSIAALAVKDGETQKAVENLKGQHASRILLIIDEANLTPTAIFEAINNMKEGCLDLTVLIIGNAESKLDNHGRASEPLKGWNSVSVSSERWRTKGVKEWGLAPGICLHFDAFESPNVKAAKTIFPFLYTYESYLEKVNDDAAKSHKFWSQTRGFWPPEGLTNTVFSETMISKYDLTGRMLFLGDRIEIASLDTAFGGDDCVLQFAALGDVGGGFGIECRAPIVIQPNATSAHEIDFQIARRVIEECKRRGVKPEHLAVDATGTGRGVAAIIAGEWGQVHRVEYGGAPSKMPSGQADMRPSVEVYDRRVTELWFSAREFAVGGQLRGLSQQACTEFCNRKFDFKGRKYSIETKEDYKDRHGRSPDYADSVVGLVDLARSLGHVAGTVYNLAGAREAQETAREADKVYDDSHLNSDQGAEEMLAEEGMLTSGNQLDNSSFF